MANQLSFRSGFDTMPVERYTLRDINGKVTGSASIGIIPNGKIFIPTNILVGVQSTATITTPPTLSIGTNSATYNNIVAAKSLTGASDLTMYPLVIKDGAPILTGGTNVFGRLTVAGVSTGTITLTAIIIGFWF